MTNQEKDLPESKQQILSEESKKSLITVDELLASKSPYIVYADQYIKTKEWPRKGCRCNGLGHYGMLSPKGQHRRALSMRANDQCICGSGKKYKKCHQERVERMAKGGWRILLCFCVGEAELVKNNFVEEVKYDLQRTLQTTIELQNQGIGSSIPSEGTTNDQTEQPIEVLPPGDGQPTP